MAAKVASEVKKAVKNTGKEGLPAQEWYDKLSKKEKCQFLSMFRRQTKGNGPSKSELEIVLEFQKGGISNSHWKEALTHQKNMEGGVSRQK